jgi:hypothetical protein
MHNNAPPYNLMRHVERDGCVGVIVQKKKGVKCWKLLVCLTRTCLNVIVRKCQITSLNWFKFPWSGRKGIT